MEQHAILGITAASIGHWKEKKQMNELEKQYASALERKQNPEEGSYTTYLYNKGLEKILKKVGEESSEVIIAALSQSNEDLVGEINDLAYHVIVLMVEKGITLEDVEAEMKRRAEKQHNLKAERKTIENY
jgi:phosphoribosyl-ATP pyrophosphohydrolase